MNQSELNDLPNLVLAGKVTRSYATHQLAIYLKENRCLFGLQKKDEDFNSDIIVMLLEKSNTLFDQFNPNYGSFFTYFFCFIKSLMNNEIRKNAIQKVHDYLDVNESIRGYEEKEADYASINYKDFEAQKVPYAYKKVSTEALKIACKQDTYHIKQFLNKSDEENAVLRENLKKVSPPIAEKILLVLALKSAYYITDSQINKIAEICHIEVNKFHAIVQNLKEDLITREKNREVIEERRNKAYFQRRKYRSKIIWAEETKDNFSEYEKYQLSNKYNKQNLNWKRLNQKLQKGTINIRPTNRAIAKALGMCERQISFYIKNAYILGLKI